MSPLLRGSRPRTAQKINQLGNNMAGDAEMQPAEGITLSGLADLMNESTPESEEAPE